MPDFERITRSLEMQLAKDEQQRAIIAAEHRGEDRARKQIACLAGAIAIIALAIYATL